MVKVEDIQSYGKEHLESVAASASNMQTGVQAIASAYGDYAKKSFEETKSFVEKLSGVKSLDKAIEAQTEFAQARPTRPSSPKRRRSRVSTPISPSRPSSPTKAWSRSSPRPRTNRAIRHFEIKSPAGWPGFFRWCACRTCYFATRSFDSDWSDRVEDRRGLRRRRSRGRTCPARWRNISARQTVGIAAGIDLDGIDGDVVGWSLGVVAQDLLARIDLRGGLLCDQRFCVLKPSDSSTIASLYWIVRRSSAGALNGVTPAPSVIQAQAMPMPWLVLPVGFKSSIFCLQVAQS